MKHKKIKSLLGAYYDGELKEKERIIIEKHLEECNECNYELSLLKRIEKLATNKTYEPGEDYWTSFPSRVKERISIREKEVLRRESSLLKNIFLKPISVRFAGVIASILIIVIVSIFYYESFKLPSEISPSEKKSVPSSIKEQSKKTGEESLRKEKIQTVQSPQQMDKKKEAVILSSQKRLLETKKGEEQIRIEKKAELISREEKKISDEKIVIGKEEMQKVAVAKRSLEVSSEEEKIYNEGLRLQQEGKYEKALENYQLILNNYPQGRRAPNAQFQINTISYSKLKKINEDSLREIIKSWEKFIEKYPDSEFIPSAKRNLAEAYYELAFLTRDKEDIEKAKMAMEDFLKLSTDEKERFERMLEELKKL